MAYVILDGTGTYTVGDFKFLPGATPCDDEQVLETIRNEGLDWVLVRDDLQAPVPPQPPAPEPPKPVAFEKFQGRDGKWYFHLPAAEGQPVKQSDGFNSEEEADEAIIEEKRKVPLASQIAQEPEVSDTADDGPLTASEVSGGVSYTCRAEGCDRVLKSKGARTNHENIVHGGQIVQDDPPPSPDGPEPELTDPDTSAEPRNPVVESMGVVGQPDPV